jgi:hypothetical protein
MIKDTNECSPSGKIGNVGGKYECTECFEEKTGTPAVLPCELEDRDATICPDCAGKDTMSW